jgi:hypothetical protein
LLLGVTPKLYSQEKAIQQLDSAMISSYTYNFDINNGQLVGQGAEFLIEQIKRSDFILLGEEHYSSKISELTKALVPELYKNKYSIAVFEVGPHSARKLSELSQPYTETKQNLYQFNSKYYHPEQEDIPIPFFDGVEDAEFLGEFSKHNFEIWGCDQEYYSSILFLGEEMVKSVEQRSDYEQIYKAWKDAEVIIDSLFVVDATEDIQLFTEIKNNNVFEHFIRFFSEKDTTAYSILQDLYSSWDIYSTRRGSHMKSVNYIRKNFLNYYRLNESNNPNSKYFIKFGSIHTGKNLISLGSYDIGVLTQELAVQNNKTSTSIIVSGRYYSGKDRYKENDLLMKFGDQEKWVAIDLKVLNNKLLKGEIDILDEPGYQELKRVIDGYDVLILKPDDYAQTPNYSAN